MLGKVCRTVALLMCWTALWGCGEARGAARESVAQTGVTAELRGLAAAAQTIFVGQIVKIERRGGVVDVSFRVEQGVTGATGPVFLLHEWAGLWAPQVQRYAVGQRVLAFVHGASGAGLSSPVHGAEGLVPIVVQGANAPRLLDVRRVAAAVVRAPGTPLPDETEAAVSLDDVIRMVRAGSSQAQLLRLPLPARGRPPVDFGSVRRATVLWSGGAEGEGTVRPQAQPRSGVGAVRR